MVVEKEISEERYLFLIRKVRPAARKLSFYSSDFQIKEKIEFLKLMGIEEIVFTTEDSVIRAIVEDCPKEEINNEACRVDALTRKQIMDYRNNKRNKKPIDIQEPLGIRSYIYLGSPGMVRDSREVALDARYGRGQKKWTIGLRES